MISMLYILCNLVASVFGRGALATYIAVRRSLLSHPMDGPGALVGLAKSRPAASLQVARWSGAHSRKTLSPTTDVHRPCRCRA